MQSVINKAYQLEVLFEKHSITEVYANTDFDMHDNNIDVLCITTKPVDVLPVWRDMTVLFDRVHIVTTCEKYPCVTNKKLIWYHNKWFV